MDVIGFYVCFFLNLSHSLRVCVLPDNRRLTPKIGWPKKWCMAEHHLENKVKFPSIPPTPLAIHERDVHSRTSYVTHTESQEYTISLSSHSCLLFENMTGSVHQRTTTPRQPTSTVWRHCSHGHHWMVTQQINTGTNEMIVAVVFLSSTTMACFSLSREERS